MSGKGNISTTGIRVKIRNISFVKLVKHILVHIIVPDSVKQVDKYLVVLSENMFQLDGYKVGASQSFAFEEEE